MHSILFCVVVTAAVAALHGCAVDAGDPQPTILTPARIDNAVVTDDDRRCDGDDECVIVDAECCDCRSSGNDAGRTAVNADSLATIEDRRLAVCPDGCADAISHDETCCAENEAVCSNGRCEVMGISGRNPAEDSSTCSLPPP